MYYLINFIPLQETVGKFFQVDIAENALVGSFLTLLISDLLILFLVLYFYFLQNENSFIVFFLTINITHKKIRQWRKYKGEENITPGPHHSGTTTVDIWVSTFADV